MIECFQVGLGYYQLMAMLSQKLPYQPWLEQIHEYFAIFPLVRYVLYNKELLDQ